MHRERSPGRSEAEHSHGTESTPSTSNLGNDRPRRADTSHGRRTRLVAGHASRELVSKKLPEQIAAVRDFVLHTSAEHSADDVARAFKGAKTETVADLLESLVALGVAVTYDVGGERRWRSARFVG